MTAPVPPPIASPEPPTGDDFSTGEHRVITAAEISAAKSLAPVAAEIGVMEHLVKRFGSALAGLGVIAVTGIFFLAYRSVADDTRGIVDRRLQPLEQRVVILEQDRATLKSGIESIDRRGEAVQNDIRELYRVVNSTKSLRLEAPPLPPIVIATLPTPDGGK